MNVKILQEKLSSGLSSALRVVSSRPTLPVLSNILLEAKNGKLRISSTDLNMGVRLWIGAKVEKEGEITVPAKVFADLITSFSPTTIQLIGEGESLKIVSSGSQSRLAGIAASEFPSLGKISSKKGLNISVSTFSDVVEKVTLAASTDETRPVLSGVLCKVSENMLQLVATDGYRLSVAYLEESNEKDKGEWIKQGKKIIGEGVILPARSLKEVEKISDELKVKEISLSLASDQNLAVFTVGDAEFTTRLIEGTFPNFTQVIPKEEKSVVTFETEPLVKLIKTASIFARDSANIIHWRLKGDELVISANAPSYGESESKMDIKLKGESGEIAFNSRYLMEFFSVMSAKKVSFKMNGSLDPGIFRALGKNSDKFFHLIMPVRVQK